MLNISMPVLTDLIFDDCSDKISDNTSDLESKQPNSLLQCTTVIVTGITGAIDDSKFRKQLDLTV